MYPGMAQDFSNLVSQYIPRCGEWWARLSKYCELIYQGVENNGQDFSNLVKLIDQGVEKGGQDFLILWANILRCGECWTGLS